MAKKSGKSKLTWDVIYPLIKKNTIKTEQIGRSAMWVVTRQYRPLNIDRLSILVPNITSGVVMVLSELEPLIRQQDHILDDGYAHGELPELQYIFQTLLALARDYGLITRISPQIKDRISSDLRSLIDRISTIPVVKVATRKKILEALLNIAKETEKGNIRDTIASAITAVFDRLNQIGVIMPAIDHRRQDAFEALCSLERDMWLFAYKASTVKKALRANYARAGVLNYLREAKIPIFRPYRLQTINAKRTLCLAIGALDHQKFDTAEKLINDAINKLGFSSIDLTPKKTI